LVIGKHPSTELAIQLFFKYLMDLACYFAFMLPMAIRGDYLKSGKGVFD
jgi:hypothetical protein